MIKEYSKLARKEFKTKHDWVRNGEPQGIVQELKFD